MGRKNPKPKKLKGEKNEKSTQNLKVRGALVFFSLPKLSIFSSFFSISIPISISKLPKSSISISKSIICKYKFQYQYQNQYFECVVFNIKININTFKILTFQKFSKFCAMSDTQPLAKVTVVYIIIISKMVCSAPLDIKMRQAIAGGLA